MLSFVYRITAAIGLIVATSAQAADYSQLADLAKRMSCGTELGIVEHLADTSKVTDHDSDYVEYTNSAVSTMLQRRPPADIKPENLRSMFAAEPIGRLAYIYPRRDEPSTRDQISRGLHYSQELRSRADRFANSNSATANLLRASANLAACMSEQLPIPQLSQLRQQFSDAIQVKDCNDFLGEILVRIKPEYRDTIKTAMAISTMRSNGQGEGVIGNEYQNTGGYYLDTLDNVIEDGVIRKRAELAKKNATLADPRQDAAIQKAINKLASDKFWACFNIPDSAKKAPNNKFPLFIQDVKDDGTSTCDLKMCYYSNETGKMVFNCGFSARCVPRSPQMPACEQGAYKLGQEQLEAYLKPNGATQLFCTKTN